MEIKILKKILASNDATAEGVSALLKSNGIASMNLMSSPGSGKTALIDKTLEALSEEMRFAIIEGDIKTTMDAQRLARHNVPLLQINTEPFGGDCHLEAGMIRCCLDMLTPASVDFLIIENVGNLVCPAEFKLGVDRNVVLLSVTEGEEKPLKYPLMFQTCDLCLITKTDLLPHLDYDLEKAKENILLTNPAMEIIEVSSKTGAGMQTWIEYLRNLFSGAKTV